MTAFLWVLILTGTVDMVGRIFRLYTGNRVTTTSDIVMNMFLNLIIMLWAAFLLGGKS